MSIIIDIRETELIKKINNLVLFKDIFKKIKVETKNLPIGDIIFNINNDDTIIFERKTISDLLCSIKDGRYNEQSYRLKGSNVHNHNIVYLIEGNPYSYKVFKNDKEELMYYSSLFSLNYYKGFSVIKTSSIDESSFFICNSFLKIINSKDLPYYNNLGNIVNNNNNNNIDNNNNNNNNNIDNDISNNSYVDVIKKTKKENITVDNIDIILLTQIPNISNVTAKSIINQFKSIKNLIEQFENNNNILDNITYLNKNNQERKISKSAISNIKKFLFKV